MTTAIVSTESLIQVANLTKIYSGPGDDVVVFRDLNLEVRRGEMVAVVGASGTGKSTLLHLLGGLDRATSGSVVIKTLSGQKFDLTKNAELDLARFRNQQIGFVFQFHHLLPEFTALENVMMPLLINGDAKREAATRATELLERVGLSQRTTHHPGELSGGERQRVALARALIAKPMLLLADEPTGNLDEHTGETIHALIRQLQVERQLTAIIVTHNERLAAICDRRLHLESGRLNEF